MPRFVQSQTSPGMVTYENLDGSPGVTVPEDWARAEGYEIAPPGPEAVLFDPGMRPEPNAEVPSLPPGATEFLPITPQRRGVIPPEELGAPGALAADVPEMPPGAVVVPPGVMAAPGPPAVVPVMQPGQVGAMAPAPVQPPAAGVVAPRGAGVAPVAPERVPVESLSPEELRARADQVERDAIEADTEARRRQAEIEAAGAQEVAARQARDANQMQAASAKMSMEAKSRVEKWQGDVEKFRAQRMDPDRFWKTRSAAQGASALIGLTLGGFLEPLGGKNTAMAMIDRAIERDMQAQEADMRRQAEALSMDRQGNIDLLALDEAMLEQQYKYRAASLDAYKQKIAADMAGLNSPIVQAAGQKMLAGLDRETAAAQTAAEDRLLRNQAARAQIEGQRLENQAKRDEARAKALEAQAPMIDTIATDEAGGGGGQLFVAGRPVDAVKFSGKTADVAAGGTGQQLATAQSSIDTAYKLRRVTGRNVPWEEKRMEAQQYASALRLRAMESIKGAATEKDVQTAQQVYQQMGNDPGTILTWVNSADGQAALDRYVAIEEERVNRDLAKYRHPGGSISWKHDPRERDRKEGDLTEVAADEHMRALQSGRSVEALGPSADALAADPQQRKRAIAVMKKRREVLRAQMDSENPPPDALQTFDAFTNTIDRMENPEQYQGVGQKPGEGPVPGQARRGLPPVAQSTEPLPEEPVFSPRPR